MISHSSGIQVLLAPPTPGAGRAHRPAGRQEGPRARSGRTFDLVVVDCPSSFNEPTLAVLDEADLILTLLTLEITNIKNIRLFLEVAEQLGYGPEKIRLVLNRADSDARHPRRDVEHSIGRKVDHTIVSDGRSVVYALNRGVPFFLSNKRRRCRRTSSASPTAVTGPPPTPVAAARRARRPPRARPLASQCCSHGGS